MNYLSEYTDREIDKALEELLRIEYDEGNLVYSIRELLIDILEKNRNNEN